MKRTARGEITVFLSLLLLLLLSLTFGLLESARVQAARAECLAMTDMGMFSLFSEYDRDLLELYEVFFIDSGYSSGGLDRERLNGRLSAYVQKSVGEESKGTLSRVSVKGTALTAAILAGDEDGLWFFRQAADWAKGELLLSALDLTQTGEGSRYLEEGEALLGEADSVSGQIEAIREEAKEQARQAYEQEKEEDEAAGRPSTAVLDTSAMEFENPIDTLKSFLDRGVLGLVLGEAQMSSAATDVSALLSRRERAEGWGDFAKEGEAGPLEGFLFNEYILQKLPCFDPEATTDGGCLQYQCEYVLAGKGSDQENLKTVLERLLLLRFGLNFACLLSSQDKQLQAEALALAVTSAVGLPMLAKVMKTAILLLWAYEESLTDVRTLCHGGRVEFLKGEDGFGSRIEELFSFSPTENSQEKGLDYQGYLRLLLAVQPIGERTLRCMDMAEHTIRTTKNRPQFCLDAGVFALKAEFSYGINPLFCVSGWKGAGFQTTGTYTYWNK